MKRLCCDISLGGSTSGYLKWHKSNSSRIEFTHLLRDAITYRAKTLPHKQAIRSACLIGVIYDQLDGDAYLLDVVISALNLIKKEAQQ